jgi:hypothetical protein
MGNAAIQKRAAANLARIAEASDRKRFEEMQSRMPRRPSATDMMQALVKEHGVLGAAEIAWNHFRTCLDDRSRKYWKLIIDGLQMIIDRRGL